MILFEDGDIIVAEKPKGVLSERGKGENMPDLLSRGGEIFVVHRLDKETRGLMVFAKNQKAAAALSRQIASGTFIKKYHALVEGIPTPQEGEMHDLLFHDRQKNKTYAVKRERKGVKRAALKYKVIMSENGRSLLDITLLTGRTHQIRAQLSSRQMPLVGDKKYGGGEGEFNLTAYFLKFNHPITGEEMAFSIDTAD